MVLTGFTFLRKLPCGMVGAEEGGGHKPLVVEEGLQREHAFEETAEKPGVFTGTDGRAVDRGSGQPWEGTGVRRSLASVGDSDKLIAKSQSRGGVLCGWSSELLGEP